MFKYITTDNGAFLQALIAFLLTASVFGVIMFRAWRMRGDESSHLASLPLSNDTGKPSHTKQS